MASTQALAARALRKYLKDNNIEGRVTSASGAMTTSVTVGLVNPTPSQVDQVKRESERYEMGSFNGMEDIYEYDNRNTDLPQVKFTFVNAEYSDELKEEAFQYILTVAEGEKHLATNYQEYQSVYSDWFDCWGAAAVHRMLRTEERGFWAHKQAVA